MNHLIFRVESVRVTGPHNKLWVGFKDGISQDMDLRPILEGNLYGPLRDPELFAQVETDPKIHALVWPNAGDFVPAILHDWPEHEEAMRNLACNWTSSAA